MSSRIFLGSDARKANMSYVFAERRSYISWLSVGYKSQNVIFLPSQSKSERYNRIRWSSLV